MNTTIQTPAGYIRVKIVIKSMWTSNSFAKAAGRLRQMNGQYDPETKTWLLKARTAELNRAILDAITETVS